MIGQNIKNKFPTSQRFSVINEELIARKNCSIAGEKADKDYLFSNRHNENSDSRSALVANQTFKTKCVFFKCSHWSDKCEAITDPSARK